MKTHTFDEVQDKILGKIGTPNRDCFEYELQLDF
jgi:HTH-type transcriptional regulator/antitoxin HipB